MYRTEPRGRKIHRKQQRWENPFLRNSSIWKRGSYKMGSEDFVLICWYFLDILSKAGQGTDKHTAAQPQCSGKFHSICTHLLHCNNTNFCGMSKSLWYRQINTSKLALAAYFWAGYMTLDTCLQRNVGSGSDSEGDLIHVKQDIHFWSWICKLKALERNRSPWKQKYHYISGIWINITHIVSGFKFPRQHEMYHISPLHPLFPENLLGFIWSCITFWWHSDIIYLPVHSRSQLVI